jgi:RNA polymerase sigma-70 factor (ECF subfamily)
MTLSSPNTSELGFSETGLLERLRSGDEAACADLVRHFGGRMLTVSRRFLRCEQDAADAVQEAFLSAFRSIQDFEGGSRLGTWLHRIVVNACLMKLRAARRRPATSIDHLLPAFDETGHQVRQATTWDTSPLERLQTQELRARVRRCIEMLPEGYRVVLLLRDIEELDTAETASRLGISESAVKVRLHRARQALRTLLEPAFTTEVAQCAGA